MYRALFLAALLARTAAAPLYTLDGTVKLGPAEKWDYVTYEPVQNRIYVSHGDHVTVVDAARRTLIGEIGPLPGGTHGIAVSIKNGIGYTDDGEAGIAASFDLKTLKIISKIPTASDADGILEDPASGHIFVINGDSGSITDIDPALNKAVTTITVGAGLEAAVADGKGHLFVDGAERSDIVEIDPHTDRVMAHFPIPGCQRPHGIAIDIATARLFATCVNKIMVVVDAANGKVLATLPIGASSDGAAFDPQRKLAFSSNGDGTLTVVKESDPQHFSVLATVPTLRSARTIAINGKTGEIFLPAADVATIEPAATKGGRPHVTYTGGSMKLLILKPTDAPPIK